MKIYQLLFVVTTIYSLSIFDKRSYVNDQIETNVPPDQFNSSGRRQLKTKHQISLPIFHWKFPLPPLPFQTVKTDKILPPVDSDNPISIDEMDTSNVSPQLQSNQQSYHASTNNVEAYVEFVDDTSVRSLQHEHDLKGINDILWELMSVGRDVTLDKVSILRDMLVLLDQIKETYGEVNNEEEEGVDGNQYEANTDDGGYEVNDQQTVIYQPANQPVFYPSPIYPGNAAANGGQQPLNQYTPVGQFPAPIGYQPIVLQPVSSQTAAATTSSAELPSTTTHDQIDVWRFDKDKTTKQHKKRELDSNEPTKKREKLSPNDLKNIKMNDWKKLFSKFGKGKGKGKGRKFRPSRGKGRNFRDNNNEKFKSGKGKSDDYESSDSDDDEDYEYRVPNNEWEKEYKDWENQFKKDWNIKYGKKYEKDREDLEKLLKDRFEQERRFREGRKIYDPKKYKNESKEWKKDWSNELKLRDLNSKEKSDIEEQFDDSKQTDREEDVKPKEKLDENSIRGDDKGRYKSERGAIKTKEGDRLVYDKEEYRLDNSYEANLGPDSKILKKRSEYIFQNKNVAIPPTKTNAGFKIDQPGLESDGETEVRKEDKAKIKAKLKGLLKKKGKQQKVEEPESEEETEPEVKGPSTIKSSFTKAPYIHEPVEEPVKTIQIIKTVEVEVPVTATFVKEITYESVVPKKDVDCDEEDTFENDDENDCNCVEPDGEEEYIKDDSLFKHANPKLNGRPLANDFKLEKLVKNGRYSKGSMGGKAQMDKIDIFKRSVEPEIDREYSGYVDEDFGNYEKYGPSDESFTDNDEKKEENKENEKVADDLKKNKPSLASRLWSKWGKKNADHKSEVNAQSFGEKKKQSLTTKVETVVSKTYTQVESGSNAQETETAGDETEDDVDNDQSNESEEEDPDCPSSKKAKTASSSIHTVRTTYKSGSYSISKSASTISKSKPTSTFKSISKPIATAEPTSSYTSTEAEKTDTASESPTPTGKPKKKKWRELREKLKGSAGGKFGKAGEKFKKKTGGKFKKPTGINVKDLKKKFKKNKGITTEPITTIYAAKSTSTSSTRTITEKETIVSKITTSKVKSSSTGSKEEVTTQEETSSKLSSSKIKPSITSTKELTSSVATSSKIKSTPTKSKEESTSEEEETASTSSKSKIEPTSTKPEEEVRSDEKTSVAPPSTKSTTLRTTKHFSNGPVKTSASKSPSQSTQKTLEEAPEPTGNYSSDEEEDDPDCPKDKDKTEVDEGKGKRDLKHSSIDGRKKIHLPRGHYEDVEFSAQSISINPNNSPDELLLKMFLSLKDSAMINQILTLSLNDGIVRKGLFDLTVRLLNEGALPWEDIFVAVQSSGLQLDVKKLTFSDSQVARVLSNFVLDLLPALVDVGSLSRSDVFEAVSVTKKPYFDKEVIFDGPKPSNQKVSNDKFDMIFQSPKFNKGFRPPPIIRPLPIPINDISRGRQETSHVKTEKGSHEEHHYVRFKNATVDHTMNNHETKNKDYEKNFFERKLDGLDHTQKHHEHDNKDHKKSHHEQFRKGEEVHECEGEEKKIDQHKEDYLKEELRNGETQEEHHESQISELKKEKHDQDFKLNDKNLEATKVKRYELNEHQEEIHKVVKGNHEYELKEINDFGDQHHKTHVHNKDNFDIKKDLFEKGYHEKDNLHDNRIHHKDEHDHDKSFKGVDHHEVHVEGETRKEKELHQADDNDVEKEVHEDYKQVLDHVDDEKDLKKNEKRDETNNFEDSINLENFKINELNSDEIHEFEVLGDDDIATDLKILSVIQNIEKDEIGNENDLNEFVEYKKKKKMDKESFREVNQDKNFENAIESDHQKDYEGQNSKSENGKRHEVEKYQEDFHKNVTEHHQFDLHEEFDDDLNHHGKDQHRDDSYGLSRDGHSLDHHDKDHNKDGDYSKDLHEFDEYVKEKDHHQDFYHEFDHDKEDKKNKIDKRHEVERYEEDYHNNVSENHRYDLHEKDDNDHKYHDKDEHRDDHFGVDKEGHSIDHYEKNFKDGADTEQTIHEFDEYLKEDNHHKDYYHEVDHEKDKEKNEDKKSFAKRHESEKFEEDFHQNVTERHQFDLHEDFDDGWNNHGKNEHKDDEYGFSRDGRTFDFHNHDKDKEYDGDSSKDLHELDEYIKEKEHHKDYYHEFDHDRDDVEHENYERKKGWKGSDFIKRDIFQQQVQPPIDLNNNFEHDQILKDKELHDKNSFFKEKDKDQYAKDRTYGGERHLKEHYSKEHHEKEKHETGPGTEHHEKEKHDKEEHEKEHHEKGPQEHEKFLKEHGKQDDKVDYDLKSKVQEIHQNLPYVPEPQVVPPPAAPVPPPAAAVPPPPAIVPGPKPEQLPPPANIIPG
ncbi:uncharacterized protein KGF55_002245 [Candida pseudojiufengensis]|uniref:uncharacterized protein n=1 Tax=Candida pseudojiufengensis TaxID=497109 RepID=UPI002224A697|nr:uncharacterized protein KGF55_002245 [Candida pseudojiufengensis]KAI5964303.1 hypothetical protein KGF55_002245 [Candida pseudojiufengensis]